MDLPALGIVTEIDKLFELEAGRPAAIQTTIPSIGDKSESAGKAYYRLPKRETKGTAAT